MTCGAFKFFIKIKIGKINLYPDTKKKRFSKDIFGKMCSHTLYQICKFVFEFS